MKPLSELGVVVLDCDHSTPVARESGHPYVAIPDIRGGRVVLETCRRISSEDLARWTARTKPLAGDVIVTRRARVGDTAPIPPEVDCAIGQNLVLLRSVGGQVDQAFLRWAAKGPLWQGEIERFMNVGAIFSSLNVRDIGEMRIPVFPLPEQHAIAEVLGALDDKIASNALLVSASDDVVGARFATAIIADAAEVPLTTLADFVNGRNFTKDATGDGRVVIRIAELRSGVSTSTVRNDVEAPVENVAEAGDILFSWSGSLRVQRWYGEEGLINQHLFKVIPKPAVPKWLVHQVLVRELQDFQAIAADKATTMGHIQRRHLERSVRIPGRDVMASVESSMAALWARALAAEQESRTLASLRDTLLPALMSGRLRVRDAEKQVEEAL